MTNGALLWPDVIAHFCSEIRKVMANEGMKVQDLQVW